MYRFLYTRNQAVSSTFTNYPKKNLFRNQRAISSSLDDNKSKTVRILLCLTLFNLWYLASAQLPLVANIDRSVGGQGTIVNITGYNFTGVTSVRFGAVPAASFIILGSNQVRAVVGNGATGKIYVSSQLGTDSSIAFSYYTYPVISDFSPSFGRPGDTITIIGGSFSNITNVKFGNVAAAWFQAVDFGTIKAIPAVAGATGVISITNMFGTGSSYNSFSFAGKPRITSIYPTTRYKNSLINIEGQYLSVPGSTPQVTFGGVASGPFYNNTLTQLQVTVSAGVSGYVKVTNHGGTDSIGGFVYVAPPVIVSFAPAAAQPTDTVYIRGSSFIDISKVLLGDSAAASFTITGDTLIKAVVGHGKTGNIQLIQNNQLYTKPGFTFIPLPPPVVQSFSPQMALTGSTITVAGQNLWGITSIKVGNTPVKYYQQVDKDILRFTAPINGSGAITVATYYGSYTLTSPIFERILPATIDSFAPLKGIAGQVVTIYGQNFGTDTSVVKVHFGAVLGKILSVQNIVMSVMIPVSATHAPIEVTVRNLTTATTRAYLPINPVIADFSLSTDAFTNFTYTGTSGVYYGRLHSFDINDDGKPDFLSTTNGAGRLARNVSTPGKPISKQESILPGSAGYAPTDVDGDGKTDVLNFSTTSGDFILLNGSTYDSIKFTGAGGFENDGAVADINSDGKPDVIKILSSNNQPVLLLNNGLPGSPSFKDTVRFNSPAFTTSVKLSRVADVNNDGLPDLLGFYNQKVMIYKNTGTRQTPAFDSLPLILQVTDIPSASSTYVTSVIPVDLNRDGLLDLLVPNSSYYSASFTIYRNTTTSGKMSFGKYQLFLNSPVDNNGISTGDLNGDGLPDLAMGNGSWTYIYQNKSRPDSIIIGSQIARQGGTDALCIVDVDGDGKQDIASASNGISVMRNRLGEPLSAKICPGDTLRLPSVFNGIFYQWQVDTGTGFTNLSDDSVFYGTDTRTLVVPRIPSAFAGYQFRCVVLTAANATLTNEPFVVRISNNWIGNNSNRNWHLATNWSCGKVPDGNTDVVIPDYKYVELTANGTCRSITVSPYSNLTVRSPAQLTITGR